MEPKDEKDYLTNKEYWEALDRKAEELDKRFQKEVPDPPYSDTEVQELEKCNDQYKRIIGELEDKEERFAYMLGKYMNYIEDTLELVDKTNGAMIEMSKYMIHRSDCLYSDKVSSGRKIEINEATDCSCGVYPLKKHSRSIEEAAVVNKKIYFDLKVLAKGFLNYDRGIK